ncbi:GmrSD restriction endonuclease domain-containing protein [Kitasatospora purpeofusca]|uniref:GmrSD restriction endonuclease domain-containing protein n=1 Tax=Kitasatospora purpeofusca TaxID=67352 RepID=UPI00381F46F1
MIRKLLRRGLTVLALAALPLLGGTVPAGALGVPAAAPAGVASTTAVRVAGPLPLFDAVALLPIADEHRDGYDRSLYKHWNRGLDLGDGCSTRAEVILSEAVVAPEVVPGCKVVGGEWYSYYDGVTVTSASGLDVDHIVPLAEVHDSGGYAWNAGRREAYANDQGSPLTLVAVTAKSNRSKADKDPAEWLPPLAEVHCRYAAEWVSTKLRWSLAADPAEAGALAGIAQRCPTTTVEYELAA